MCGIFGYLNYLVPKSRRYITDTLLTGLQRLEYRGYDSAGIAFDGGNEITLSDKKPLPSCIELDSNPRPSNRGSSSLAGLTPNTSRKFMR